MTTATVTTPLDRQSTMRLILDATVNPGLPVPSKIEFDEYGGIDGGISALRLRFDTVPGYAAWADWLEIPRGWQREDDEPHPDIQIAMYHAVAFGWNGWSQVQLTTTAKTCERCHNDAAQRNCSAHLDTHGDAS